MLKSLLPLLRRSDWYLSPIILEALFGKRVPLSYRWQQSLTDYSTNIDISDTLQHTAVSEFLFERKRWRALLWADSFNQSSYASGLLPCMIHRESIHMYRTFLLKRRATKMASRNVRGSVSSLMFSWKRASFSTVSVVNCALPPGFAVFDQQIKSTQLIERKLSSGTRYGFSDQRLTTMAQSHVVAILFWAVSKNLFRWN